MLDKAKSAIIKFLHWIKFLFWTKPVSKSEPPKLLEVQKDYICILYRKQMIQLHKSEIPKWNSSPRKFKRATADRFAIMEKKGQIRFEKINGKWFCVKNRDYQALADKAKEANHGL